MFFNKNIFYVNFKSVMNPKANIIFTHGLGENTQDYVHLANFFNSLSYNILLYDVRGHGKSSGKKGDIKNFHVFLDDLKYLVDFVKKKNNLKIFLIGHSMGGIIVNNYLVKYGNVDGAIISSTPVLFYKKNKFLKYPFYFFNFFKKKLNFNSSKITYIPIKKGFYPYRLDFVTPRLLRNLLFLSLIYLEKKINFYLTTVLFLYSLKDEIVFSENINVFFDKIMSKDKSLYFYEKSYHNLFHDIEKDKIFQDIFLWLEKKI
ncbi:alpha/beta hydrolase fold family protein [Candidatus Phytoplasma oryzae]|uniref:Alpha/beta hydrolase fold family protein n=1 Tax=Candidatus Phytoplasma oryzae TaxID=203274 RepID=A0A139JQD2_9MOLU|nr:alpha/beta fold hydrolase [Candidatus Phytoplasma oryzae]KXT29175.1 alpha/beta hydrolase fold family protein [Candidatus Phytoplasma oryzae]RAM58054.1 lysophospholipase [Candidatus Phytoplasma oryzae]